MAPEIQQLLEIVKLLALEAPEQISFFPSFVDVADELAILWGEQYDLLKAADIIRELGPDVAQALRNIGSQMAKMDGHEEYFSTDALATRPEWISVRQEARDVVTRMRLSPSRPVLWGITYVPGGK